MTRDTKSKWVHIICMGETCSLRVLENRRPDYRCPKKKKVTTSCNFAQFLPLIISDPMYCLPDHCPFSRAPLQWARLQRLFFFTEYSLFSLYKVCSSYSQRIVTISSAEELLGSASEKDKKVSSKSQCFLLRSIILRWHVAVQTATADLSPEKRRALATPNNSVESEMYTQPNR